MLLVYKQLENGVIDFSDSITVDVVENIPNGYIQIDTEQTNNPETNVRYKEDGTLMTQEENEAIVNAPKEPSPDEMLQTDINAVAETTAYTLEDVTALAETVASMLDQITLLENEIVQLKGGNA